MNKKDFEKAIKTTRAVVTSDSLQGAVNAFKIGSRMEAGTEANAIMKLLAERKLITKQYSLVEARLARKEILEGLDCLEEEGLNPPEKKDDLKPKA